jgi:hypothetical protein
MGESLELVISTPKNEQFLKKIGWNKQEFMTLITSMTEKYKGAVYTEDQIPAAKKDRASLNAMKKAISDRRIQVKKAVMAPYEQFEDEVKEVVALIDEPLAAIDKTIKESEENSKNEKKRALQEFFDESVGELSGILAFDMVFDRRMLNATYTLSKAKGDIADAITRAEADLRIIDELVDEKYRLQAKDYYFRTMNISGTIREVHRLAELDLKLEEQQDCERIRLEDGASWKVEPETKNAATDKSEPVTEPAVNAFANAAMAANETQSEPQPQPKQDKLYKARFYAIGTKDQLMALKQYMVDNKIEFGKVV